MKNTTNDLISIEDLSKRWNCHTQTIKSRTNKGQLKYTLVGSTKMYTMDSVLELEKMKPIRKYTKATTVVTNSKQPKPTVVRPRVKHTCLVCGMINWFKNLF